MRRGGCAERVGYLPDHGPLADTAKPAAVAPDPDVPAIVPKRLLLAGADCSFHAADLDFGKPGARISGSALLGRRGHPKSSG
jgi:hypothetical protein